MNEHEEGCWAPDRLCRPGCECWCHEVPEDEPEPVDGWDRSNEAWSASA